MLTVYPCAYRELIELLRRLFHVNGLSLCIQGTPAHIKEETAERRFIPVHTGNSRCVTIYVVDLTVYPCAYRELKK